MLWWWFFTFPGQECMLEKPFSPTVNVCGKVKYSPLNMVWSVSLWTFLTLLKVSFGFCCVSLEVWNVLWARCVCLGNGRRSLTLPHTISVPCLEHPQWFVAPKLTIAAPAHLPLSLGVHLDVPIPAFPRVWVFLVLGCGVLHLMVQELLSGTASEREIRPKCYFEMVIIQRWWTWAEAGMLQPFTLSGHWIEYSYKSALCHWKIQKRVKPLYNLAVLQHAHHFMWKILSYCLNYLLKIFEVFTTSLTVRNWYCCPSSAWPFAFSWK